MKTKKNKKICKKIKILLDRFTGLDIVVLGIGDRLTAIDDAKKKIRGFHPRLKEEKMEKFNNTPEDVEIASALTDDELRARIELYQKILESRKPVNMVSIDWTGIVQDIRKGKPYFAEVKNVNGEMKLNFLTTIMYEGKRFNATATAVFRGELPEGTIVKFREGASWKNDYTYYGVVKPNGIEKINEIEAKRLLGIIK